YQQLTYCLEVVALRPNMMVQQGSIHSGSNSQSQSRRLVPGTPNGGLDMFHPLGWLSRNIQTDQL
ncbi:hypothetical protein M8C21_014312, partial [Ambrosia artemisiifolia]